MKIKSIDVNNMYSYDEFNIEFNEGIAVIVGPNNAGKSNLFRLIEFLKNSINGNIKTNEIIHHLHDETKRNACIKINVEFGDGEKELLKKFLECYFSRDDVYSKPDEEYIDIFIEIISKGKIVWEYNGEFEGYIQPVYYATPKIEMNGEINTILELINNRKNELIEIIGEDYDKIESKYLLYQLSGNKTMISNDKSDREVGEKLESFKKLMLLELITDLLQGKKSVVIEVSSDRIKRYKYNDRNSLNLNTNFKSQSPELFLNITNTFEIILKELNYNGNLSRHISALYTYWTSSCSCELKITNESIKNDKKFDAKNLFEFSDLNFINGTLNFHKLIIKLFDKSIKRFEEVRGYPENQHSYDPNKDLEYLGNGKELANYPYHLKNQHSYDLNKDLEYLGNGKELANYLYHLKNYDDPKFHEKYNFIKEKFEEIFENEEITFDVRQDRKNIPKIKIIFKKNNRQLSIDRVGSGIFEVLNILSVIIGAEEKVILLDEPALHLHPKYQKKLLNVFRSLNKKDGKEGKNNQTIIITHSPYLVDTNLLSNTFRFYKNDDGKTQVINIYDEFSKNNGNSKDLKDFLKDDVLVRSLFANGVILAEGDSEYLSVPILLRKLGCALEDYNIEFINVSGKDNFKKYVGLMNALKIPCAVICDGDTAFSNGNNIIKVYKDIHPFWIENEIIDEILDNFEDDDFKINMDSRLRNELFIYACEEHDWTDFLVNKFKDVEINGKTLKEVMHENYGIDIEPETQTNTKKIYKIGLNKNGKRYEIGLNGVDNIPQSLMGEFIKYLENSGGKYNIIDREKTQRINKSNKLGISYIISKEIPKTALEEMAKNNEKLNLKQFVENFINSATY